MRNVRRRMPYDAHRTRIPTKSILKFDKSNSTAHTEDKNGTPAKKTSWMVIRAHELSIARIISNWSGQMHVYQYIFFCDDGWWQLFAAHVESMGIAESVFSGACHCRYYGCFCCCCHRCCCSLTPKLCVLVALKGTRFTTRLSCHVTIRQAITIGKTKLTNNQNKIKTFKYLLDWIKKFYK